MAEKTAEKTVEKTVLCVYGGRRRPVSFGSHSDPTEERKNLLEVAEAAFKDVLDSEGCCSTTSYYLQQESKEWGGLIDLVGYVEDHSTVHLCCTATTSQVISSSKKAKDTCRKLSRPSEANAKVLRSLFPGCSSSSSSSGTKKMKFDPTSDCVVADQQRRKKSAFKGKGRSKSITVVALKEIPKSIPKGATREGLKKIGRVKEIPFRRYLTGDEVRDLLTSSFSHLGDINVEYLQPHRNNALTTAEKQELNGIEIIELAKSGSLYLRSSFKSSCPENRNTALLQKATVALDKLHDPESSGSSSPEIVSPVSEDSDKEEKLVEWRRVRAEQDQAFKESLEIDSAKELSKQKRDKWLERVDELQKCMKMKFKEFPTSGTKIGFKLPSGTNMYHVFNSNSTVKVMYQFVLGNGILPWFTLKVLVGNSYCELGLAENGEDCVESYRDMLVHVCHVESEDHDLDKLELFCDSKIKDDEKQEVCEDERERESYMESIAAVVGVTRSVERSNLFEDVMDMYREGDIVGEYPIFIAFKGELGVDDGGLRRDMFTAFWEIAYSLLFEGATTLIPMVHPQIDMKLYPIIGRIISHGYLACGILPDRIALPSLIGILLGPAACVNIGSRVLLDSMMDYMSRRDREVLMKGTTYPSTDESFPPHILEEMTGVLSRFGCRHMPKPSTFLGIMKQAAEYEFCTKPAAAIALMNSGIPLNHKKFWDAKSPNGIQLLHQRISATPSKVISLLEINACNPAEERVGGYLTTMIGNMQVEELWYFLRFVQVLVYALHQRLLWNSMVLKDLDGGLLDIHVLAFWSCPDLMSIMMSLTVNLNRYYLIHQENMSLHGEWMPFDIG